MNNRNRKTLSFTITISFVDSLSLQRYRKVVLNNCTKGVKEMYTARKQQCPNRPPKGLLLTTKDGKLTANLGSNVTFLVHLDEVRSSEWTCSLLSHKDTSGQIVDVLSAPPLQLLSDLYAADNDFKTNHQSAGYFFDTFQTYFISVTLIEADETRCLMFFKWSSAAKS